MKPVLRRILAVVLTVAAVMTPVAGVYAEPAPINPEAETGTEGLTPEEAMKKSYDRQPETNSLTGWPKGPQVYGNAAIVMDVNSGAVLYAKSIDDKHYPASITKMMTALVALENSSMDDEVLFSQDSVDILEWDYASIGMTPG